MPQSRAPKRISPIKKKLRAKHALGPNLARNESAAARKKRAGRILAETRGDVPAEFLTGLLGRAAPEDLMVYDAREIAKLAARAWELFAERKPGTARVRLSSLTAGDARLNAISVLEILNDDMPFLLDSVMGELAERGLDIHLVVHPVLRWSGTRRAG